MSDSGDAALIPHSGRRVKSVQSPHPESPSGDSDSIVSTLWGLYKRRVNRRFNTPSTPVQPLYKGSRPSRVVQPCPATHGESDSILFDSLHKRKDSALDATIWKIVSLLRPKPGQSCSGLPQPVSLSPRRLSPRGGANWSLLGATAAWHLRAAHRTTTWTGCSTGGRWLQREKTVHRKRDHDFSSAGQAD